MSKKTSRNSQGVAWSAVERFGIQGSQLVATLILARLLTPSDYGVVAMLSIFMVVSTALVDSGMAQALIQRQNRSQRDLTTALIANVAIATLLYVIIYMCAPAISRFYSTPQLTDVARVYSIVLIINSLGVVQQALITISLDFKRQAFASLTAIGVGSCVAIAMAYWGFGVWALVAQQIVSDTLRTAIIWALARWRPTGGFSWSSFLLLSKFGSKIMVSGLIHVIYVNLYPLIIGRHFATSQLGLFNRATTIGALPSQSISTIVDRALYPILCESQECSHEASATLHRYLRMVCFFVFPAMVGVSIVAEPLVLTLLGEGWVGVAPLLRIVAIAYMWDPIMKFMGSIIKSQGHSGEYLRAEVLKKIAGVAILLCAIPHGISAMAYSLVLYAVADMAIVILFSRRISLDLGYLAIARALAPLLVASIVMGGALWAIMPHIAPLCAALQLAIAIVVGVASYLLAAAALRLGEPRLILNTISKWR